MSDVAYSKLRDRILKGFASPVPIPVVFSETYQPTIEKLNLGNLLFTRVLSFADNVELSTRLEKMEIEGKVSYTFNKNADFVEWLISKGIVDASGEQVFSEQDIKEISGQYMDLIYFLCWEILDTNNLTKKAQQETVKNSEGTESPNV